MPENFKKTHPGSPVTRTALHATLDRFEGLELQDAGEVVARIPAKYLKVPATIWEEETHLALNISLFLRSVEVGELHNESHVEYREPEEETKITLTASELQEYQEDIIRIAQNLPREVTVDQEEN